MPSPRPPSHTHPTGASGLSVKHRTWATRTTPVVRGTRVSATKGQSGAAAEPAVASVGLDNPWDGRDGAGTIRQFRHNITILTSHGMQPSLGVLSHHSPPSSSLCLGSPIPDIPVAGSTPPLTPLKPARRHTDTPMTSSPPHLPLGPSRPSRH